MLFQKWFSDHSRRTLFVLWMNVFLLVLLAGCGATKNVQPTPAAKPPVAVQTPPVSAPVAVERQTTEGVVIGFEDEATRTNVWKAIPYAKPPVGALRWKAPQTPEKHLQPLKADQFCSICPQYIDHDGNPATDQMIVGNEDCLYLNIWSPKKSSGQLPVFFWIHGGGNSIQWPLLSRLNGGILADRGKMIVVTFNYRLGPMGFFNHPALKTGNPAEDSGNYALLDIIAALKWVQANIANFGGDPKNVTIAGESAGGENVFSLLACPLAAGLFHRAISESGVIRPSRPEKGEKHVNGLLAKMLVADGKAADVTAAEKILASMSVRDIQGYMQSKSAADFLALYPEGKKAGMIFFPTSYVDGTVLPLDIYTALASGKYNQVPMLLGTNKEETKLFLRGVHPFGAWRQDTSLFKDPAKMQLFNLVAGYQSDGWKVMAADSPARLMRDNEGQPFIFAYQFLWGAGGAANPVMTFPVNVILGACHAMEIDFVFGTEKASLGAYVFNDKNKPGRIALSNAMLDYWSHFAATGNPNRPGSGLPKWSPWSNIAGFPKTLLLDADLEKAKISMSRAELTAQMVEEALKAEARQKEIQPFYDRSSSR